MRGGGTSETPTESVVRHALARGFVTEAQVQAAFQQSSAGGSGVLPLLRPYLTPAQLAELTAVFRAAEAGGQVAGPTGTVAEPQRTSASAYASHAGDAGRTVVAPTPMGPTGTYVDTRAEGAAGAAGCDAGVPGSVVGPYVIERELGRGGMGVVSAARHREVERRVALKQLLPAGVRNPVLRERFLREAQALARLDHPGVVRVYESGESPDGGLFMAMDLVEGEALDATLKREGKLEPRAAAALLERVARAVAHAHERGILHRDLKPANILVDSGGAPRVTDFGLALDPAEEQERLTQSGQMLGTPAYMPPEQAAGEKEAMDERSDVYALGATLFDLVSGEPPFNGTSAMNVVTKVLNEPAPRLSAVLEGADRDLETIVAKCLEKERFHRYRSALALADDLGRYARDEPIAARPLSIRQRAARWRRRHPKAVMGLVALGALALVAAAIGARALLRSQAGAPLLAVQPLGGATAEETLTIHGRVSGAAAPFEVRVELEPEEGEAPRPTVLTAAQTGDFRARVRLAPGSTVVRVSATDSWGTRVVADEQRVTLDQEPPRLTLAPPAGWLAPSVVLTGTLSEGGCALAFTRDGEPVEGFVAEVDGREARVTLPYAALERGAQLTAEDAVGNQQAVRLPLWLAADDRGLETALAEGAPGEPVYLAAGSYRVVNGRVGRAVLGARPLRLLGVRPLPAVALAVEIGQMEFGRGEDPTAGSARLVVDGSVGVELTSPGGHLELRGVAIERPMGVGDERDPRPTFDVRQGELVLEGVLLRSNESGGVRVGVGQHAGEALAVVDSSTLVSASGPAVRVGRRGRARVTGSRLVGDLSAAGARGLDYMQGAGGRAHYDNLVVVIGGALDLLDARCGGYGGGGLYFDSGATVALERVHLSQTTSTGVRATGVRLSAVDLDVDACTDRGLYVSGRSLLRLERCRVRNTKGEGRGLDLHQLDAGSLLRELEVSDCLEGLRLYGEPRYGDVVLARVEGGRFHRNRVGVALDGAGPVTLVGARIEANTEAGVRATQNKGRPAEARLERCVLERNGPGGAGPDLVRVDDGSRVDLVDTTVAPERIEVAPAGE